MGSWDDVDAFKSGPKAKDPGKTDTYFSPPGQEDVHGHVVESQTSDGQTQYHYARDNQRNVYIDDNPQSTTYTGHRTERRRRSGNRRSAKWGNYDSGFNPNGRAGHRDID